jgi:hypothetical protein
MIVKTGVSDKFKWSKTNNHDTRHHNQQPTPPAMPDQGISVPMR